MYYKGRMTCSKFSAQNKVTRPFEAVFGRAVFIGTEQNVSGVFDGGNWVSLDLRRVGHQGQKEISGGSCVTKIRIKEFNPRLIYFHYLQD